MMKIYINTFSPGTPYWGLARIVTSACNPLLGVLRDSSVSLKPPIGGWKNNFLKNSKIAVYS